MANRGNLWPVRIGRSNRLNGGFKYWSYCVRRVGQLALVRWQFLLGLSTTTVHRLLRTLKSCRAVQQDPQTHLYDLNDYMLVYGKAVLNRFNFMGSVHPILGDLSRRMGETVFMGILDDQFDLIYIDQVDSLDHPLRMTPQIGSPAAGPFHIVGEGLTGGVAG